MLKKLVLAYEDSIINEEKTSIQMKKFLKVEKYMTKNDLYSNDLILVLEEVGALSQMSVLNDWLEDLKERVS
jgi:hypothetical protein